MALKDVMDTNEPNVYNKNNALQFDEAIKLLDNIKRSLPNDAKARLHLVVDAGCGSGNVTQHFARVLKPDKLIGFDLSQKMIDFCRQKEKPVGLDTEICFERASFDDPKLLTALQLQPDSVDLVYSVYVFHWLKDKAQGLRNVYEMLRPGGRLHMVSVIDSESMLYRHKRMMQSEYAKYFPTDYRPFAQRLHPDMDDIRRPGNKCGLSAVPTDAEIIYYFENLFLMADIPNAKIQARNCVAAYDSIADYAEMATQVIGELGHFPAELHEKYQNDYRQWCHDYMEPKYPNGGPMELQYTSVFVEFQKPDQQQ